MGCFFSSNGLLGCLPERCLRLWWFADRSLELCDLASTLLYCLEAYRRLQAVSQTGMEEALWVTSVVVLAAAWFHMLIFHAHFSQPVQPGKQREVDICHVGAGFCCLVIPLIFVLVFGLSYWNPTSLGAMASGLGVWLVLGSCCLGAVGWSKNTPVPGGTSAGLDAPGLGHVVACRAEHSSLEEVIKFRHANGYYEILRLAQDVPGIVMCSIDLSYFGASWYALMKLSLSVCLLSLYCVLLVVLCAVPRRDSSKTGIVVGAPVSP